MIVAPDPAWPAAFARLGSALRTSFGERAIAIHHIGSTSWTPPPSDA